MMSGRLKRALLAGLALAATGLISVACIWYVYLPHYRPGLEDNERYGVDVSNHQGNIDWSAVAADNVDFAYIKATEGGDFVDAFFQQNWRDAQAAGLDVGVYHFFTLCRPGDEQAANLLATVPLDQMDLPIALDLEFGGNCAARPPVADIREEITTFVEIVETAADEELILYVGPNFDALYAVKETFDRELWERRLWRRPAIDDWTFWQWSFRADVDGIEGGVDLNIGRPSPVSESESGTDQ